MKWAGAAALLVATLFAACQVLPERFAVNAPLRQMLLGRGVDAPSEDTVANRITVPSGFSVGIWAEGIPGARFLRFTEAGDLLVSQPRSSAIVIARADADGDGRTDGVETLVDGLNRPHGLDLRQGWLYVGETDGVVRMAFDSKTRSVGSERERIVTGLPTAGNHWTRTLRFGPDDKLYVSVGSSCNVCLEEDERRAAMLRFAPDGSEPEVFARGLRNSVGFDWQPETDALYATDNGRDLLGDDFPPCELNLVEQGRFYGWPFANGDNVIDPDLGAGHEDELASYAPPAYAFGGHTAPLGITFVRSPQAPDSLKGAALVALHGSWNRTTKSGYKVVSLHWGETGEIEERDFLTGFEVDEDVIGRPVDVAEGPDGAFYVSDDYAGVIWRVSAGTSDIPSLQRAAPAAREDPLAALGPDERERRSRAGEATYERYACASCHDPAQAAEGVVAKPLQSLDQRYGVEDIVAFMATPTPPMPVFPLEGEEAQNLAVYLLDRYGTN